ncbi:hypothetical protein LZ30DRAFT_136381 [Colletotrichum cereale]|nr:hypothetical protein LZ30DRAFT_136381 [Colletotrichum cereale]
MLPGLLSKYFPNLLFLSFFLRVEAGGREGGGGGKKSVSRGSKKKKRELWYPGTWGKKDDWPLREGYKQRESGKKDLGSTYSLQPLCVCVWCAVPASRLSSGD